MHLILHFIPSSILITITIALKKNNEHVRYYHMDATQSVGLVQTNFSYPDFLVVQI